MVDLYITWAWLYQRLIVGSRSIDIFDSNSEAVDDLTS